MMVDYTFYKDVYGGVKIPAEAFDKAEQTAEQYIHKLTYYRLIGNEIPEHVRMAVCAAAESIDSMKGSFRPTGVNTVNNDGYSVSYAENYEAQVMAEIKASVSGYLPPNDPLRCAWA